MKSIRIARRAAMVVLLSLGLAAPAISATTPSRAGKPVAKPASTATATSKNSADAPFWSAQMTPARLQQINTARIARAKASVAKMLAVTGPRTVENTLVPLDEAYNQLDMAGSQAGLIENVHPQTRMRETAEKLSQAVAAYGTELSLNRAIYDAVTAIDVASADAETRYYVEKELRDFRLAGVDKDEATRGKIKATREVIVRVGQDFDRNIREDSPTVKVKPEDLEGLPQDFIDSHKPGTDGLIELSIEYPDYYPVMTYAKREDLRRRMYMASQNRAYPKNMAVLDSIILLRHELAQLVGFPNYAEYECSDKMVGGARQASDFIARVVRASESRMKRDYETVLARKRKESPSATHIDWWDRWYWTNLVKKEQYDFDTQALRPYLPYARVKQGVLDLTSRLFGVTFQRVKTVPVWHPSVECYEMFEDGKLVGRFYLDMHPRKDKFNHAAQFGIRDGIEGKQIAEAALVCNLPGNVPGDPGLCDYEDATTFLHEFGHLLHTLFGAHRPWVGTSGIRTEHDFVEAPSQMLEEWMRDPKTLALFARHYKTNEVVPEQLVQQLRRATEFGDIDPTGISVRRQMVLADLSLSIYNRPPSEVDTDALNRELTNRYTPYPYVPNTHFQSSFGHLYGYGAAYYTYMWSLVIAKDLFSAFDPNNLLDPGVAKRYREAVLAPGGSKPAAKLVEDFLGRPFGFDAYERWLNQVQ